MSILVLQIALASGGAAPAAIPQEAGAKVVIQSDRLGLQRDPAGNRVVALDDSGQPVRSLALDDERAVFGPGEIFALVDKTPWEGARGLLLMGPSFDVRAETRIPASRDVAVGLAGAALFPRSEHMAGTPFEIEFLDGTGRSLTRHSQDARTLYEVRALEDGGWAAFSLDPFGEHHVHRFDSRGAFQWEYDSGSTIQPSIDATAELAALGVLDDDVSGARLDLVDSAGRVVTSTRVPPFLSSRLSPDGERVALVGRDAVSFVRSADGALLWSRAAGGVHPHGSPVAFSRKGDELVSVFLRLDSNGAPAEAVLRTYASLEGRPSSVEQSLGMSVEEETSVMKIEERAGSWRVATRTEIWSIN